MNRKEILKANILGLLSGEKKPEDVYPHCVMHIGYGDENVYRVNGKDVSEEAYNQAVNTLGPTGFKIHYGGENLDENED